MCVTCQRPSKQIISPLSGARICPVFVSRPRCFAAEVSVWYRFFRQFSVNSRSILWHMDLSQCRIWVRVVRRGGRGLLVDLAESDEDGHDHRNHNRRENDNYQRVQTHRLSSSAIRLSSLSSRRSPGARFSLQSLSGRPLQEKVG